MENKPTKKQRIVYFLNRGYSNREIANFVPDVSERYIRKLRCELGLPVQKITPEKYYKTIMKNTGTKEDLAAKLGVSERSLNYFERDNKIKKQTAQYMRVNGMGLHAIAEKMGTNISTLKEMGIDKVPIIYNVKNQIEAILEILEVIAQWDADATTLFYQWKKAFERLK